MTVVQLRLGRDPVWFEASLTSALPHAVFATLLVHTFNHQRVEACALLRVGRFEFGLRRSLNPSSLHPLAAFHLLPLQHTLHHCIMRHGARSGS